MLVYIILEYKWYSAKSEKNTNNLNIHLHNVTQQKCILYKNDKLLGHNPVQTRGSEIE